MQAPGVIHGDHVHCRECIGVGKKCYLVTEEDRVEESNAEAEELAKSLTDGEESVTGKKSLNLPVSVVNLIDRLEGVSGMNGSKVVSWICNWVSALDLLEVRKKLVKVDFPESGMKFKSVYFTGYNNVAG